MDSLTTPRRSSISVSSISYNSGPLDIPSSGANTTPPTPTNVTYQDNHESSSFPYLPPTLNTSNSGVNTPTTQMTPRQHSRTGSNISNNVHPVPPPKRQGPVVPEPKKPPTTTTTGSNSNLSSGVNTSSNTKNTKNPFAVDSGSTTTSATSSPRSKPTNPFG